METVKLLLKHNADPYKKNDFGDDAIHTASLRGYQDILDYLIARIRPSIPRQIEAFELMGTNFVDEKHDIQRAIQIWKSAMEMRFRDAHEQFPKEKNGVTPNAAYQFHVEATSLEELDELAMNPDALYMQSLLIRERILGPDHKDTIFGLMYRGAVYADTHRYQRCVDLWKYAFQLRHEKHEPLNHECLFTLQALCKLFWEIYEEHTAGFTNETVQQADLMQVLEMATKEVSAAKEVIQQRPIFLHQQEEFHLLMLLLLHLIHLLLKMDKDADQTLALKRQVHQIVKMNAKGMDGKTLLHLAVDRKSSNVSEEFYSKFPEKGVVEILIECGAPLNAFDEDHNVPLHSCAEGLRALMDESDVKEMELIISVLIDHGAHVDARNLQGKIAGEELCKSTWYKLCLVDHVSLKCLAARKIKECQINYEGEVPVSLTPFIELH